MSGVKQKSSIAFAVLMLLGSTPTASAQTGDGFNWSITPYIWASDTSIDISLNDVNLGGDISFSDLLDVLDSAIMIHVEGGKGNWSAFGDFTYLEISDSTVRTLATIDVKNEQIFFDAGVAYWPDGFGSPFSLFGGLRYTGFDTRLRFFGPGGTLLTERLSDNDYYDALLGIRYRFALSDRWDLLTHGDLSFGDSEGTFILRANFGYTVGQRRLNRILFGYQYKEAEYKDGDLVTDWTFNGPMAGFNFRF